MVHSFVSTALCALLFSGPGSEEVSPGLRLALPGDWLAAPLGAALQAQAAPAAAPAGRGGRLAVKGGIGFTLDPDTFLMAAEGDFFLTRSLSIGPLLQLGVTDDEEIIAPSLNVQCLFDIPDAGLERLKPFIQGGVGAAYIREEDRPGEDDDFGFLMNFGAGVEFYLKDQLSIGNNILFNFMPDKVLDENFFVSWQFLTLRWTF